jgi:hypothetical protein
VKNTKFRELETGVQCPGTGGRKNTTRRREEEKRSEKGRAGRRKGRHISIFEGESRDGKRAGPPGHIHETQDS